MRRRSLAWLFLLCAAIGIFANANASAHLVEHSCCGHDYDTACPVCLYALAARTNLPAIGLILLGLALLMLAAGAALGDGTAEPIFVPLVLRNVRMND